MSVEEATSLAPRDKGGTVSDGKVGGIHWWREFSGAHSLCAHSNHGCTCTTVIQTWNSFYFSRPHEDTLLLFPGYRLHLTSTSKHPSLPDGACRVGGMGNSEWKYGTDISKKPVIKLLSLLLSVTVHMCTYTSVTLSFLPAQGYSSQTPLHRGVIRRWGKGPVQFAQDFQNQRPLRQDACLVCASSRRTEGGRPPRTTFHPFLPKSVLTQRWM